MKEPSDAEKLKCVLDPRWRLNNLYQIVDKKGTQIPFRMNWAQQQLYDDMWYCNIVLKARQLGISTFICLLFLDRCLFNENMSAGILAHTLEDGQQMFRRVKFAYDTLPDQFKQWVKADNDTANMLKFSNGSSLRVGTSLRGSSLQYLHISEFGKICSSMAEKAREIITGSLNTIDVGQYIFIESTAEGRSGYFFDMCKKAQAQQQMGSNLTKLDYKFHFFPWWKEKGYRLGSQVHISEEMHVYFNSLLAHGIQLDLEQKAWYINKLAIQKDDMKREFCSTPDECWEVSNEGTYYGKYITAARIGKRICHVPYDEELLVNTAWDLGYNDSTAIWYFQVFGKEIRVIDYDEGSGESLAHWLNVVKKKPYTYDKHLAPHDIKVTEYSSGMSRLSTARKLGVTFIPCAKLEIIPGIDQVRNILPKCWFDQNKCEKGITALENYKKEWNERLGCWASHPRHDASSHGADSFRTLATGLHYITNTFSAAEKAQKELEEKRDQSGLLPGHFLYDAKDVLGGNTDYLKNRFDTKGKQF
jgi:hypothetical protein